METSQEPPQDLAIYLGLQGFDVESVEVVGAPRLGAWGRRIKLVHLLRRSGRHTCPDCGKGHWEGLFEEFERVRFRDCSIGDFETYLEIRAMRVACCGGTRVERLPFAMEGFRMTRRFFERVAALCTKLPIYAVAEMAGLSWDTVARVDKRAIALALGDQRDECPDELEGDFEGFESVQEGVSFRGGLHAPSGASAVMTGARSCRRGHE